MDSTENKFSGGDKALNKYRLTRSLPVSPGEGYEQWIGEDEHQNSVLIKAWPFGGKKPADEERALWNLELRNLYRLANLPNVERHLITLVGAGLDKTKGYFVLVLDSPGFVSLDQVLSSRKDHDWLSKLGNNQERTLLWRGILRLAQGLEQIHQLRMLHRAISPRVVFLNPGEGASSFRLNSGEMLMRLGGGDASRSYHRRHSVQAYSFEEDWFQLGHVIAQILFPDVREEMSPNDIQPILEQNQTLNDDERNLIRGLLSTYKYARLSAGPEICNRIRTIIASLVGQGPSNPESNRLGLVVSLGPKRQLSLAIAQVTENIEAYHVEAQREFIQTDLDQAKLVRTRGDKNTFILVGKRLCYQIQEYLRPGEIKTDKTWKLAWLNQAWELKFSDENQIKLDVPITVYKAGDIQKDEHFALTRTTPWQPYLFKEDGRTLPPDWNTLEMLHDLFRVANQIELLMRDSEIYAYRIVNRRDEGGLDVIEVEENREATRDYFLSERAPKMIEFLAQEFQKPDGKYVYLSDTPKLHFGQEIPRNHFWEIREPENAQGFLELARLKDDAIETQPGTGYLRTYGLFGQLKLIKRRRQGIDRLINHTFLLRSLQNPGFNFLDMGRPPPPLDIDRTKLDDAKASAIHSIWRTRPIFALQGPPGTGKTTLVAKLLALIFQEDSVAQVLVTAQAHTAVDVLMDKVKSEFEHVDQKPLLARLSKKTERPGEKSAHMDDLARDVLGEAIGTLSTLQRRTPLQNRWLEAANQARQSLGQHDPGKEANDFRELIKKSAGITFCTSTSGELESLAQSSDTFDWSIVEEAGKAHGFDLVLPLQTGHRWLLIGDHKQLEAYRIDDYFQALNQIDKTFTALENIRSRASEFVDRDLLLRWSRYDELEKTMRKKFWKLWIGFFSALHRQCSTVKVPRAEDRQDDPNETVLAKMLYQQHRMHPVISNLVSKAYYEGKIQSMTVDSRGQPLERVIHPFETPRDIQGKAIVWVDVPWNKTDAKTTNPYISEIEIQTIKNFLSSVTSSSSSPQSLAVLSPYRRQVQTLKKKLFNENAPAWMKFPDAPHNGVQNKGIPIYTVDSFQGNQADVVVVSLVRNNAKEPSFGLGFLAKPERMNVLFSRAQKMLVLVGSWDFFQHQLQYVAPDANQLLGSWRIAIDYLGDCLSKGTAIRIRADSLMAEGKS